MGQPQAACAQQDGMARQNTMHGCIRQRPPAQSGVAGSWSASLARQYVSASNSAAIPWQWPHPLAHSPSRMKQQCGWRQLILAHVA